MCAHACSWRRSPATWRWSGLCRARRRPISRTRHQPKLPCSSTGVGRAAITTTASPAGNNRVDVAMAMARQEATTVTAGARGGDSASQQPWLGYFAHMCVLFPLARSSWVLLNAAGVLGPWPGPHS
jgi:hypothetical protein